MTLHTLIGKEISSFEKDGAPVVFCRLYFTHTGGGDSLEGIECEVLTGGERLCKIAHDLNVDDVCLLSRDGKGRVTDVAKLDDFQKLFGNATKSRSA